MSLIRCGLLVLVALSLVIAKDISRDSDRERVRRDGGLTTALIEAAISAGTSLVDTSVGALMRTSYSVAVSGSIENYSKWPMVFKGCEIASGFMNTPARSVSPGQREGFASHKTGNTATGSWIKCSFTINTAMVHFMYSAPFDFNIDVNTLGFAICPLSSSSCRQLTASKMFYGKAQWMVKRQYYYNVHTLKVCGLGFCMTGVMGTNHQPELDLKVMPTNYADLCSVAKDAALKDRWTSGEYEKFVKNQ